MTGDPDDRYEQRMARRKATMDERIAKSDTDRGVLVVLTGDGKGKSSSAFGMVARCLGYEMPCAIICFIKSQETGELRLFRRLPGVEVHLMGEGFTWETQNRSRDRKAADRAWEISRKHLRNPDTALVVLDELCVALSSGMLELPQVLDALRNRPPDQHVVVTGRAAPQALIDLADTVSDVRMVKHAFQAGVRAQRGIEL
ncbi:MAG: cob(I)yrinic acid a,c-diamide adenosyltransferase [bacterium]|nr:cob(I)yrinic acid a,c-diamide adenosyltransferase [bacterium]MCP5065725.1 cob(I)yrinic acid a,c-diamide adenosyltransferase [bacterium]